MEKLIAGRDIEGLPFYRSDSVQSNYWRVIDGVVDTSAQYTVYEVRDAAKNSRGVMSDGKPKIGYDEPSETFTINDFDDFAAAVEERQEQMRGASLLIATEREDSHGNVYSVIE